MPRSEKEVVNILREIYRAEFAGKRDQRFLISWADLREIYGYQSLYQTRFDTLVEEAGRRGAYLFDLGQTEVGRLVAVVPRRTVHRWRRVPRKVIEQYRLPVDDDGDEYSEEC